MEIGRSIFECLGNKAALFFGFARQGATFVYGNKLVGDWQVFAFTVSPNCSLLLSHFLWKKYFFSDIASHILLQFHGFNTLLLWGDAMGYQKNGLRTTDDIGNDFN